MIHTSRVLVIIGSVRARRIGPDIAHWVAGIGRAATSREIEIVDLKDWPLPTDDEPGVPAAHGYDLAHTKAWSAKVAEAGAFVFVTPQYNWGYPAPLKNALDHLYKEWSGKPAMIVSYGSRGGGKCARQLRQVLKGLHMKPVSPMPGLRLARERIKANEGTIEAAQVFARHEGQLRRGFAALDRALRGRRWSLW
jgi:NAD(P)H-dependent FMN reductase